MENCGDVDEDGAGVKCEEIPLESNYVELDEANEESDRDWERVCTRDK